MTTTELTDASFAALFEIGLSQRVPFMKKSSFFAFIAGWR